MALRAIGWNIVWSIGMFITFLLIWPAMACQAFTWKKLPFKWMNELTTCAKYMFLLYLLGVVIWLLSK